MSWPRWNPGNEKDRIAFWDVTANLWAGFDYYYVYKPHSDLPCDDTYAGRDMM